jgi:hypothetical protein
MVGCSEEKIVDTVFVSKLRRRWWDGNAMLTGWQMDAILS